MAGAYTQGTSSAKFATPSAKPSELEIKANKQINFWLIAGAMLMVTGLVTIGFIIVRSKIKSI